MKLTCLIVEDERNCREVLESLLKRDHPDVEIIGLAENVSEARSLIKQKEPDILFLDIEIPGGNGFSVLNERSDFEVIFTTSYDKYALDAIKVQPADYLLKPINSKELSEALQKVRNRKRPVQNATQVSGINSQDFKLAVTDNKDLLFILVSDILYCKADGSYTEIYFKTAREVIATRPLKEFEESLSVHGFFRIHNSLLVNLQHVVKFSKSDSTVELVNGVKLEVSVRRKSEFIAALNVV